MQTTERVATHPFHETIVEAIRQASSVEELRCLATLIKATKIPKGHDEIIAVWNEAMCWDNEDLGVSASLLKQKSIALDDLRQKTENLIAFIKRDRQWQTSKKKVEGEKRGVNLDDLRQETEKLFALLKDPQPGLMMWNDLCRSCLQNLHKLVSQALGK